MRALGFLGLFALAACDGKNASRAEERDAGDDETPDAGMVDAGDPDAGDGGVSGPEQIGPLTITTTPSEQKLDLFGTPGHRFWVEVSDKQLLLINSAPSEDQGGGPGPIIKRVDGAEQAPDLAYAIGANDEAEKRDIIDPGWGGGDIYTPGAEEEPTFAKHVVVKDAKSGSVADYGKIEVKLVGQFSRRQWTSRTIPNLRFDTDEFQDELTIGGYEHFRLNNALVGTIFGELLAYRMYRALGYPAVKTSYAWVGSNVWGDDIWVPMVLVEVYKKQFCDENQDMLGGTCTNMWEFPGDAAQQEPPPYGCQLSSCDDSRLTALREAMATAPSGEGFRDALASVIDWPMFHKFQCLSWMLETPDDPIHASNNNLIIEREDGKLVWAPYSVDISQGNQGWGGVSLYGQSALAMGCQSDPACWADTIATCEDLIDKYVALKPEKIVDQAKAALEKLGMMRPGDEERAQYFRDWHVARKKQLKKQLEDFRAPLDHGCIPPTAWCETFGSCMEPISCPNCKDPTPYYCAVAEGSCAESYDACTALCEEGQSYCVDYQSCIPDTQECGGFIPI